MGVEGVADLPVELLEPVVQGQDLLGEVCGDAGRSALAWEGDALGLGGCESGRGHSVGVAYAPGGEPASEAGLAAAAQGGGGLVAGEQDEGALWSRSRRLLPGPG